MKTIFTLLTVLTFVLSSSSQVIWESSFEENEGFNTVGSSVKGSALWAGSINSTSDFWLNMWSDANPRTMTANIDASAHLGSQSMRFDSKTENGNPRFRTDKTGYTNGDTIKISYWAKTNEAGVNLGGKLMSITKGVFSNKLTTSYAQYTDYGIIANGRVQIFFKSSTATDSFSVWIDDMKIEYSDILPAAAIDPEFTSFPVTEDFESDAYQLSSTICSFDGSTESDIWPATDPKLIDRFWRGNNTRSYVASIDASANGGSKALKIHVNTTAQKEFKLRTVNIPVGKYKVKLFAKTDVNGVGTAKLGFNPEVASWHTLTTEYQEFSGQVEVAVANNGTTKLIMFFLSSGESTEALDFNVWIDDISIEVDLNTTIKEVKIETLSLYPNPVGEILIINDIDDISQVNIYNLAGKKVMSSINISNNIDVSSLNKGVYILETVSKIERLQKRFIKY